MTQGYSSLNYLNFLKQIGEQCKQIGKPVLIQALLDKLTIMNGCNETSIQLL